MDDVSRPLSSVPTRENVKCRMWLFSRCRFFLNSIARICDNEHQWHHHWLLHHSAKLCLKIPSCAQKQDKSHALFHMLSSISVDSGHFNRVSHTATNGSHITHEVVSLRRLRSGSQQYLIVPRTRLWTIGNKSFRVTAARAWNRLPTSVTTATSLASFKIQLTRLCFRRCLKTSLFQSSFDC